MNIVEEKWIAYMNEAREALSDIYFDASETLPGKFKLMVASLAYKLQERDKK